jgi:hypothetical protein
MIRRQNAIRCVEKRAASDIAAPQQQQTDDEREQRRLRCLKALQARLQAPNNGNE